MTYGRIVTGLAVAAALLLGVLLASLAHAGVQPGSGIDSTRTVGSLSSRELFRWIYALHDSTADTISVAYASHANLDTTAAPDSVWIADLVAMVRSRVAALIDQHREKNRPALPPNPLR